MLSSLKLDMNKIGMDLVVAGTVLLLEDSIRWELSRHSFLYLLRINRFLPAKVQPGTDLMNLVIVLPDILEVQESEKCPIMECFWHDNCLVLFIPRFEGLKLSAWGFLLQVLNLKIWMNMVPYDVQSTIFFHLSATSHSSRG